MPYNSANLLDKGSLSTSVIEGVRLIGQEAKGNARWYLEAMGESVDPAFHTWVIAKDIAVEIAELQGVPF